MKTWTSDEVSTLLTYYNAVSNSKLKELLPQKTNMAIYKKAYKMGLRKTPEIEFKNRSESRARDKSSSWKGGKKVTAKGYCQVLIPEHPRADANGYVMEHIVVWESHTGIIVPMSCCIHHLNGDKTDNRIQNLCLMDRAAHTVFHHTGLKRSDETRKKISEARLKSNVK